MWSLSSFMTKATKWKPPRTLFLPPEQVFIIFGIYNVWNSSPGFNHPLVGNGVCNKETNIDRPVHVHLSKFIQIHPKKIFWHEPKIFFLIYRKFYPNLIYLLSLKGLGHFHFGNGIRKGAIFIMKLDFLINYY